MKLNSMVEKSIFAPAAEFAVEWTGKGNEKQDTQAFWLGILQKIFGVGFAMDYIEFEKKVETDGHIKYIDAYIPDTKVLIEQKSINIDLDAAERQSDGEMLTPFQQAKRYNTNLPLSEMARWIVVSNFKEFRIYDMEAPTAPYVSIMLEDLGGEYEKLRFVYNVKEEFVPDQKALSEKAGEVIGKLYDALREGFADPDDAKNIECLNILCVRLVFLLYAESAYLLYSEEFANNRDNASKMTRSQFRNYLKSFSIEGMRDGLLKLFKLLNTPYDRRSRNEREDLLEFVYVNGGLFSEEFDVDLPRFTEKSRDILINECSRGFNWRDISPSVFGGVFESTLNPYTRRKLGMHYTSPDNIHKAIDPLLIDELKEEFDAISNTNNRRFRYKRYLEFQEKLGNLTFLDPACGSGNFLTETYMSLRELENEVLKAAIEHEKFLEDDDGLPRISASDSPIKVKISNFYGIEIEPFAVSVAKTALWIAEVKMKKRSESVLDRDVNFFPIKSYSHIKRANALHIDWNTFEGNMTLFSEDADDTTERPPRDYDYIIGNPPFVGNNQLMESQREDLAQFFPNNKTVDYVACWYIKTAKLLKISKGRTRAALVSTNSITQGEQVELIWKELFTNGIKIDFAWTTFKWTSKSLDMAAVHIVVIGFSEGGKAKKKYIYGKEGKVEAKNINAYLIDAPDVFIASSSKPLCDVPEIRKGNQPTDGGNLILTEEEYEELITKEPKAKKYIKKLINAKDFLNGICRYCLWLVKANEKTIDSMPLVRERVERVRQVREASPDSEAVKIPPHLFREQYNFDRYIIIPSTTSENREYVPLGFLGKDIIPTNANLIIPDATVYHFGVLTSSVHMAWMRAVCGRLEMRYRYSKDIVYNNFIWCDTTEEQKKEIEQTAQEILDARKKHKGMTLAQMYNKETMPEDLREVHKQNDLAVMRAYGFEEGMEESEIVGRLMGMYEGKVGRK